MRMDVIGIAVSCYHNFKAGDLLRQLQRDHMRGLGCKILVRMEGLDHVIVHPATGAVVKSLGVHELLQGKLWHAIDTADQGPAFVIGFGFLTAVVDDTV